MNRLPIVSCLNSSLQGNKPFTQDQFDYLLPLAQSDFSGPAQSIWTYRHYFRVIEEVLARDDYALLSEAVKRQLAVSGLTTGLPEICIFAEKHGNWYHPAKIEVLTPEGRAKFVLNVALTERGQAIMAQEVKALKVLADHFNYPWLPTLYFYQESVTIQNLDNENDPLCLSLFLADWFEGFHEFHLSIDPVDGIIKLILWDGSSKPNYLANRQVRQVYQQISKTLTLYYNLLTYEQIFPWHHGAGDFVAKLDRDLIEVRLVTVRQYGPLVDPEMMSAEEALFFFFLNLSIRMRLDRLDGIGEIVWAGEDCLVATWEGFIKGLEIKEREGAMTLSFRKYFFKYLSQFNYEALTERFSSLLASYNPEAPDLPVIKKNIVSHIQQVHEAIHSLVR